MKQLWKKHWPMILSAVVWACGLPDFWALGFDDTGALGLTILISGVLFPLCALFVGVWYGYRVSRPAKWLLIPLFALLEALSLSGGDLASATTGMALLTAIPSALGLAVGSLLAWKKRR